MSGRRGVGDAGQGRTTNHAAFALRNTGLDSFLFAGVGTELNGSSLTVLSVLARLDRDPWAEAAGWTTLPRNVAVDRLADCIGRMPLEPRSLAEACATAARLIQLLPPQVPRTDAGRSSAADTAALPGWRPLALFMLFLAMGIAVNLIHAPAPTAPSAVPIAHVAKHGNGVT